MLTDAEPMPLADELAVLRALYPRTDWAKMDDPLAAAHELRYGTPPESGLAGQWEALTLDENDAR